MGREGGAATIALTDELKTAILINAMPVGIQDQVFQQMSKEANYSEIEMLIKRFATRKMEASGPTPRMLDTCRHQVDRGAASRADRGAACSV